MKRKPMSKNHSKKSFKKSAGTHGLNTANPRKMRGGIRL